MQFQIHPGYFQKIGMKPPVFKLQLNFWEGDSAHRIALYSTNLFDIGGGIASGGGMTFYVIDTGTSTGIKSAFKFDGQQRNGGGCQWNSCFAGANDPNGNCQYA